MLGMTAEPTRKRYRAFRPRQYAKAMGVYPKTVYNWRMKGQMPEGANVVTLPSKNYRIDVDLEVHPWMPFLAELDSGELDEEK